MNVFYIRSKSNIIETNGHVLHSDLGDTVNRIDSTGFAEVMDVSLTMMDIDEPSSSYFSRPILALI
ncbi:MAG: hypothetical protein M0Q43_06210 [Methanothrix sp.]|nr:hypothetical protein [Methanothrix sp.]